MNKMNQAVKAEWVAALRSGEYKQGRYALRSKKNEFCCLGVLCNVHAQNHPAIAAQQKDATQYLGNSVFLPQPVMDWAELQSDAGAMVVIGRDQNYLSALNDCAYTFAQIADAIESQL